MSPHVRSSMYHASQETYWQFNLLTVIMRASRRNKKNITTGVDKQKIWA